MIYRHSLKKINIQKWSPLESETYFHARGKEGICSVRRVPTFLVAHGNHCWHFLCHAFKFIVACGLFLSKTSIWLVFHLFPLVPIFSVYSVHLCHHWDFFRLWFSFSSILLHYHFPTEVLKIFTHISDIFTRLLVKWIMLRNESDSYSHNLLVITGQCFCLLIIAVFFLYVHWVPACSWSRVTVKILPGRAHVGHSGT